MGDNQEWLEQMQKQIREKRHRSADLRNRRENSDVQNLQFVDTDDFTSMAVVDPLEVDDFEKFIRPLGGGETSAKDGDDFTAAAPDGSSSHGVLGVSDFDQPRDGSFRMEGDVEGDSRVQKMKPAPSPPYIVSQPHSPTADETSGVDSRIPTPPPLPPYMQRLGAGNAAVDDPADNGGGDNESSKNLNTTLSLPQKEREPDRARVAFYEGRTGQLLEFVANGRILDMRVDGIKKPHVCSISSWETAGHKKQALLLPVNGLSERVIEFDSEQSMRKLEGLADLVLLGRSFAYFEADSSEMMTFWEHPYMPRRLFYCVNNQPRPAVQAIEFNVSHNEVTLLPLHDSYNRVTRPPSVEVFQTIQLFWDDVQKQPDVDVPREFSFALDIVKQVKKKMAVPRLDFATGDDQKKKHSLTDARILEPAAAVDGIGGMGDDEHGGGASSYPLPSPSISLTSSDDEEGEDQYGTTTDHNVQRMVRLEAKHAATFNDVDTTRNNAAANVVFVLVCLAMAYHKHIFGGKSQTWIYSAVLVPLLSPVVFTVQRYVARKRLSEEELQSARSAARGENIRTLAVPEFHDQNSAFPAIRLLHGLTGHDNVCTLDAVVAWCWAAFFILMSFGVQEYLKIELHVDGSKSYPDGSPILVFILCVSLEGIHGMHILGSYFRLRRLKRHLNQLQNVRSYQQQHYEQQQKQRGNSQQEVYDAAAATAVPPRGLQLPIFKHSTGVFVVGIFVIIRLVCYVVEFGATYGPGSGVGAVAFFCLLEGLYFKTMTGKRVFCISYRGRPVDAKGTDRIPMWDGRVLAHPHLPQVVWDRLYCVTYKWDRPKCHCNAPGSKYLHKGRPQRHCSLNEARKFASGHSTFVDWLCPCADGITDPRSNGIYQKIYRSALYHKIDATYSPSYKVNTTGDSIIPPLQRLFFPFFPVALFCGLLTAAAHMHFNDTHPVEVTSIVLMSAIIVAIGIHTVSFDMVFRLTEGVPFQSHPQCVLDYLLRQERGMRSMFENGQIIRWCKSHFDAQCRLLLHLLNPWARMGSWKHPWFVHVQKSELRFTRRDGADWKTHLGCHFGCSPTVVENWFRFPNEHEELPLMDALSPWTVLTIGSSFTDPAIFLLCKGVHKEVSCSGRKQSILEMRRLLAADIYGSDDFAVPFRFKSGLRTNWIDVTLRLGRRGWGRDAGDTMNNLGAANRQGDSEFANPGF